LIDDEPGVLRALSLVLQALKCAVKPCNKPGEGVTSLAESLVTGESWDAILCDLRMPGMSGLDVLSAVRATGSRIPFILMSGHATTADIDESAALGADGFLPKPFSPGQLAGEIARLKRRAPVR
jgi:CheY-like chemotaxis protein